MTTGTVGEDGEETDLLIEEKGLVSGHAYSLIGAYEITLNDG